MESRGIQYMLCHISWSSRTRAPRVPICGDKFRTSPSHMRAAMTEFLPQMWLGESDADGSFTASVQHTDQL